MSIRLTLGEKLTDLRKEKKLTLAKVAEKTGLSVSTISNYENDKEITAESLCKLLEVYGITADEFYGLDPNYGKGLEIFKQYGFSEEFFREIFLLSEYDGQQIAKCLNRLFESPLCMPAFFENLSQALDPAYHEKMKNLFPEFSHDAAMRFLLEPVFQSLIVMFEALYPEYKD